MILSILMATAFLAPRDSADGAERARQAEQAFDEGLRRRLAREKSREQFRIAVAAYEDLHRRGANNRLLYRNLGNARMLAGDLPGAILAYRLGLRLAPGDNVLRFNLEQARERVAFREGSAFGRPPADERLPWVSASWLFTLAVIGYAAGCFAVTRWWMLRRRSMLWTGALLLATATGLGGFLLWQERENVDRPLVVIAADGVLLRKGNSPLFPPRYETPLNRGVEAQLLYRRDDWLQIELSGGEVGWVSAREAVVEE